MWTGLRDKNSRATQARGVPTFLCYLADFDRIPMISIRAKNGVLLAGGREKEPFGNTAEGRFLLFNKACPQQELGPSLLGFYQSPVAPERRGMPSCGPPRPSSPTKGRKEGNV